MYPEIKKEIENGLLVLEGGGKEGVPKLKDKYADLRKKAKTMNFSIAYGKTAHGFSKDWDCSLEEA
jgi:DNA polymerase-1